MKADEFFNLVNKMRSAQENYLARRTTANLISARELERMVDRVLKSGLTPSVPAEMDEEALLKLMESNDDTQA